MRKHFAELQASSVHQLIHTCMYMLLSLLMQIVH